MYLYETHCHTAKVSACSRLSPEETVELYLCNGYSGIFVTDHFLNGNTTVDKGLPFAEAVEKFCEGFEEVKRAAGERLQVFFGFEYSYLGTDVLCYGWDKKTLLGFPQILSMSMREFCDFCRENGALAVQAHPFREDFYIDHIRLFPNAEGVETFNAGRTERCNKLGEFYADAYGKIRTGGSDLHSVRQKALAGMEFEEKITSERDFLRLLREGKGQIVVKENKLAQSVIK